MSQFVPNGYLIQDLNKPTNYTKTFEYFGINAYNNFPLSKVNNKICQELTDLQLFKKAYDEFVVNEIIGDGLECSYIFKVYEVNVKK